MNLDESTLACFESEPFDVSEYKRTLSGFPTGVAVVTAVGEGGRPVGITVNSFTSVSLDPPVVLWSLRQQSSLFSQFMAAEVYAINVLACDQQELVRRFSAGNSDRFAGVSYSLGAFGLPLLKGAVSVFECRKVGVVPVGDHVVLLGQVLRFSKSACEPLVMHSGRFVDVISTATDSRPSGQVVEEKALLVARAA